MCPLISGEKIVIFKVNLHDLVHSFCMGHPQKVRRPISAKNRGGPCRVRHPLNPPLIYNSKSDIGSVDKNMNRFSPTINGYLEANKIFPSFWSALFIQLLLSLDRSGVNFSLPSMNFWGNSKKFLKSWIKFFQVRSQINSCFMYLMNWIKMKCYPRTLSLFICW